MGNYYPFLKDEIGHTMIKLLGVLLSGWLAVGAATVQAESKLPDTLAKIKPGIVAVGTYLPKRNPRASFMGTGFVIAPGNLVVTNAHVIPELLDREHLEEVAVFYRQGDEERMLPATVAATDKAHDLAVLKISATLTALPLGDAAAVREGQVYAFTGYPIGMVLGLFPVTHRGMISAITPNAIPTINAGQINPKLISRLETPYKVFQLDATAYPGNSGSPLYDADSGRVVGVIDKVFVQESKESLLSHPSGISYAIPVTHLDNLLKDKQLR
jgi:S1-C subfamily serine protease